MQSGFPWIDCKQINAAFKVNLKMSVKTIVSGMKFQFCPINSQFSATEGIRAMYENISSDCHMK